jgi:hypothetical protein
MRAAELADGVIERPRLLEVAHVGGVRDDSELLSEIACSNWRAT